MGRRRRHKRVNEIEDEERDLVFGRQRSDKEGPRDGHSEFGRRAGRFIAAEDEWPAKTVLDGDSDVNKFVRARAGLRLMGPDLSDPVESALESAIEDKEKYLSSKDGKGRKQYTEMVTAWAGGTAEQVAERALGVAGRIKDDLTPNDD